MTLMITVGERGLSERRNKVTAHQTLIQSMSPHRFSLHVSESCMTLREQRSMQTKVVSERIPDEVSFGKRILRRMV